MREDAIKDAVFNVLGKIAPEADLDSLAFDEDLRKALDIDSFDFLNVMIALNEALGVEIPESDYPKLETMTGMLNYLSSRLN
jgi:acyl carrier protein